MTSRLDLGAETRNHPVVVRVDDAKPDTKAAHVLRELGSGAGVMARPRGRVLVVVP
jgi:hypothetical protein